MEPRSNRSSWLVGWLLSGCDVGPEDTQSISPELDTDAQPNTLESERSTGSMEHFKKRLIHQAIVGTEERNKGGGPAEKKETKVARKRAVCRSKYRHKDMELFKLGSADISTSLCKTREPLNVGMEKALQMTYQNNKETESYLVKGKHNLPAIINHIPERTQHRTLPPKDLQNGNNNNIRNEVLSHDNPMNLSLRDGPLENVTRTNTQSRGHVQKPTPSNFSAVSAEEDAARRIIQNVNLTMNSAFHNDFLFILNKWYVNLRKISATGRLPLPIVTMASNAMCEMENYLLKNLFGSGRPHTVTYRTFAANLLQADLSVHRDFVCQQLPLLLSGHRDEDWINYLSNVLSDARYVEITRNSCTIPPSSSLTEPRVAVPSQPIPPRNQLVPVPQRISQERFIPPQQYPVPPPVGTLENNFRKENIGGPVVQNSPTAIRTAMVPNVEEGLHTNVALYPVLTKETDVARGTTDPRSIRTVKNTNHSIAQLMRSSESDKSSRNRNHPAGDKTISVKNLSQLVKQNVKETTQGCCSDPSSPNEVVELTSDSENGDDVKDVKLFNSKKLEGELQLIKDILREQCPEAYKTIIKQVIESKEKLAKTEVIIIDDEDEDDRQPNSSSRQITSDTVNNEINMTRSVPAPVLEDIPSNYNSAHEMETRQDAAKDAHFRSRTKPANSMMPCTSTAALNSTHNISTVMHVREHLTFPPNQRYDVLYQLNDKNRLVTPQQSMNFTQSSRLPPESPAVQSVSSLSNWKTLSSNMVRNGNYFTPYPSPSRRQSIETINSSENDYPASLGNGEVDIKINSKWYRIKRTLYEAIPRGKLCYLPQDHVFIRYFNENQKKQLIKNIHDAKSSALISDLLRQTNNRTEEMFIVEKNVTFSTSEQLSEPELYVEEIEKVRRFAPKDFYGFYRYVSGYQIVRENKPISFLMFLTLHNTNHIGKLLEDYVRSLIQGHSNC